MLKARDVMTKEVITIRPDVLLPEAIKVLVDNKVSGMPVCDAERHVLGIISEKDIINFIFSGNLARTRVDEVMSRTITSFPADADIDAISLAMGEKHIRRVPILEDDKLVGIVSRRSIIRIVLDMPSAL